MCTYQTFKVELDGAAKGAAGWFTLTDGAVYVDHPYHACHEHTVNIDFTNPGAGPSARVAVELTEEAALALVAAIQQALAAAPPGLASGRDSTAA
ncbi:MULTISPECIES: DUF6295 family protein [Actinomadura]|uniref:Uncharacterized protein n=1 Tax=Actinomadura geliboluensis TaxID=882440 RepID=A0A5S4H803_9ACTN|nr:MULTISPECIES: DUF6295 family protein [Actinomadura]QKW37161.1 hypothetical protein HUT06_26765 [Actinomadura sp. NAK00032]TMR41385.1 hypothetical protein ETD96_05985 [Actinomadura geliboluensis]